MLPLALDPRPKELVRVLVGRLEFITDAARERVEHALLLAVRRLVDLVGFPLAVGKLALEQIEPAVWLDHLRRTVWQPRSGSSAGR